MKAVKS